MRLTLLLILSPALLAQDVHVKVDPNGPGSIASTTDYKTVQQALDHAPEAPHGRIFIHIAPGTYTERINVTQNRPRVTLLGEGKTPGDVVITAAQNARSAGGTFFTETAEINGEAFEADNITFANAAGPTGQAVAAAVRSDRAVFKHCRFLGDQDTLFADYGRQLYLGSYIEGGVDFIFGNAAAVFERGEIHEIRNGYLTAQSRTAESQPTGYVLDHVKITAAATAPPRLQPPTQPGMPLPPAQPGQGHTNDLVLRPGDPNHFHGGPAPIEPGTLAPASPVSFFLGRPWRLYSRVIVMNSDLPASLNPAGWSAWSRNDPTPKAFYAEYNNTGPGAVSGAVVATRVPWSHQLTRDEAEAYTPAEFLAGQDHWDAMAEAAKLP